MTEDTSQIPENLAYYIDYERMGRDMELSGDIYTIDKCECIWTAQAPVRVKTREATAFSVKHSL